MLIGEICNKTGFSRDTIRFYEKQGFIFVGRKERRANNYKEYSEGTLERLLIIKRLKNVGFTLNEIVELLEMVEEQSASCEKISQKMANKVAVIENKIKELEELKYLMNNGIHKCETCCPLIENVDNCPVLMTDMIQKL